MKRLVLGLIGLFGFVAATSAQINSNGRITGLPEGSPTCTAINGPDVRTLTDAQGNKWSFGRNYPAFVRLGNIQEWHLVWEWWRQNHHYLWGNCLYV